MMILVILLALSTAVKGQTRAFGVLEGLIQSYKQTTLPLREDVYQKNKPIFSEYDYVIAGASPAGCVIANRLTEDPSVTVLLLEAGPEAPPITDVPGSHIFFSDTDINWNYYSEYNPRACRGMKGKLCNWPSGKAIGGGTTWNGMIYTRGNARDFDDWAATGNIGWSYNDVLPYFRRFENIKVPDLRKSPYRGTSGPLNVTYAKFQIAGGKRFMQAMAGLGIPEIDYNAPYTEGAAPLQSMIDDGARVSAVSAYLKPIQFRKNLHIVQKAMVTKILIDSQTKEALGVEFVKKNLRRKVQARREVVVSGGGFGSPKLLMLSGIGPAEHLRSIGIPLIQDHSVGKNLQEHLGSMSILFIDTKEIFTLAAPRPVRLMPEFTVEYLNKKTGPLTSAGVSHVAYVKSPYAKGPEGDIELLLVNLAYSSFPPFPARYHSLSDESYEYWKQYEDVRGFQMAVMGCYPKSRGSLRLRTANPVDPPVINNNFFADREDLAVIVDGLKWVLKIANSTEMREAGVKIVTKPFPPCARYQFGSDAYLECLVQQITVQYHHQSGTVKMGPDDDPNAVVDPRLRVRGIKRLRVADASIMPSITAGHTTAPSYMIGEKAAEMIKQDAFLTSSTPIDNTLLRLTQFVPSFY